MTSALQVSNENSPDLATLIALFYSNCRDLGKFESVAPEDMPRDARLLLAHDAHMTVTVEAFHGCKVKVEVLDRKQQEHHYSRKILLRRTTDNAVVQFGIPRLDMRAIPKPAMDAILSESIPLGQTLIDNGVLRRVELCHLWKIQAGPDLANLFSISVGDIVYGRTAMIHVDETPAIELLEIVTTR
jgi:chorismate-pyruvate lyase